MLWNRFFDHFWTKTSYLAVVRTSIVHTTLDSLGHQLGQSISLVPGASFSSVLANIACSQSESRLKTQTLAHLEFTCWSWVHLLASVGLEKLTAIYVTSSLIRQLQTTLQNNVPAAVRFCGGMCPQCPTPLPIPLPVFVFTSYSLKNVVSPVLTFWCQLYNYRTTKHIMFRQRYNHSLITSTSVS